MAYGAQKAPPFEKKGKGKAKGKMKTKAKPKGKGVAAMPDDEKKLPPWMKK